MKDKNQPSRISTTFYWIATVLLCLGMFSGAIGQLLRFAPTVAGITHLGYPVYFTTLIGTWKILGVIVLVVPGYGLLKEWAYAGFFFAMSGAVVSHMVSGDSFTQWVAPFIFCLLVVMSWWLRPEGRRVASAAKSFEGQPSLG